MPRNYLQGAFAIAMALAPFAVTAQDTASQPATPAAPATSPSDSGTGMTAEQQGQFDSWPADRQSTFRNWPSDYQSYYWTLTPEQQNGYWALSDQQRSQLGSLGPDQRQAALNAMMAAPGGAHGMAMSDSAGAGIPPPPASDMNKTYPPCSKTLQDNCRNRGGV